MNITIKSEELTVVCKTLGGELTSIKDKNGTEYLWQADAAYWAGQAPVLFPIVGSIPNGEAVLPDGRKVAMPRHGLIRKEEFQVVNQEESEVTFSIRATEEMKKAYPFDFEVRIQYKVEGKRVSTTYNVYNHGTETMPYTIGGHPAFHCPVAGIGTYEDYEIVFPVEETVACPLLRPDGIIDVDYRVAVLEKQTVLPVRHSLFENDALVFDTLQSREVTLRHKEEPVGIRVLFDGMDYLGIWSAVGDAPFVALEPWMGISSCTDEGDSFAGKRGMQMLDAGSEATKAFVIEIMPYCQS
ncbi:MAG: aldose 1-epimerase family protein [Lachnospiraceae bacterium]